MLEKVVLSGFDIGTLGETLTIMTNSNFAYRVGDDLYKVYFCKQYRSVPSDSSKEDYEFLPNVFMIEYNKGFTSYMIVNLHNRVTPLLQPEQSFLEFHNNFFHKFAREVIGDYRYEVDLRGIKYGSILARDIKALGYFRDNSISASTINSTINSNSNTNITKHFNGVLNNLLEHGKQFGIEYLLSNTPGSFEMFAPGLLQTIVKHVKPLLSFQPMSMYYTGAFKIVIYPDIELPNFDYHALYPEGDYDLKIIEIDTTTLMHTLSLLCTIKI